MRGVGRLLQAFALVFFWSVGQCRDGEPLAVVVARGSPVDKLSLEAVRLIFNRKSLVDSHGNRWIPVNLPATDALRRRFSLALFGALPEDLEDYWNVQYFHGITPPEVLGSEEAILRFVAATPGAIGYIHAFLADERVKTLCLLSRSAPSKLR